MVIGLIVFTVCYFVKKANGDYIPYKHPDFKTQYTKEEHFERIWDLTVERFKKDFEQNKIKGLFVDIVYAFYDDDPEYFLVEIEYYEERAYWASFTDATGSNIKITTKFIHTIGYIKNDNYYSSSLYRSFIIGKSAYTTYGARDCKKYYGRGVQAALIDGKLIEVLDTNCLLKSYPEVHDLYCSEYCDAMEGKEVN